MACLRFHSSSMSDSVDEFLLHNNLETDSKDEAIFSCLEEYSNKHNIPVRGIMAVVTDGAPAMIDRYRGFSVFLKGKVPTVHTVYSDLHRQHLVGKKLIVEMHEALKVCIKSINKAKYHHLTSRQLAKICDENVRL